MIDWVTWVMNQTGSFIGTMAAALIFLYVLMPRLIHSLYTQIKKEILSDPALQPYLTQAKELSSTVLTQKKDIKIPEPD